MQASDDFTTSTQSMIDKYRSCKMMQRSYMTHEANVEIYNPSTRSYGKVDVDVLKSDDGVFHVFISLPVVDLLAYRGYAINDPFVTKAIEDRMKVDQEIICCQVKAMFDNIHELMLEEDDGWEVSWFASDVEDCYQHNPVPHEGLMVFAVRQCK